jgi:hypothetical protein
MHATTYQLYDLLNRLRVLLTQSPPEHVSLNSWLAISYTVLTEEPALVDDKEGRRHDFAIVAAYKTA